VYVPTTEGFVYALDTETGELVAEKELSGTLAPAGPVIVNDTLFVGSQDSNVYAVPLTDFEEVEQEIEEDSLVGSDEDATDNSDSGIIKYIVVGGLAIVLIIVLILARKRRRQ